MNKKSIIFLSIAIIFFIIAIIISIFLYSNKNQVINNEKQSLKQSSESIFKFYDNTNKEYTLSDFSDKPLAIILWKSDAENSLNILELVDKYYADYSENINFLVINTQEPDNDIIQTVNNCNFSFPIYYDKESEASNFYQFSNLPVLIFFETDGTKSQQIEETITEDSFTANLDIISHNY